MTSVQDIPQTFMDGTCLQDMAGYNVSTIPPWLQEHVSDPLFRVRLLTLNATYRA